MKRFFYLLIGGLVQTMTLSGQTAKKTSFDPFKHGLQFSNDFISGLPFDIRTRGLCGGMVYTSLDYYYKGMPVPKQDYRPAERTPLQSYIYGRQVNSLETNLDKWAEVGFNPGGARDNEFFEWGLKGFGGGRIQELKEFIDNGKPVVLGLQGAGGASDGGNHQVLAIGYDMGRYKGDLKDYKEDFKIFIYDPNYPGQTKILVPDLSKKVYYYSNHYRRKEWRTWFVDKKYSVKAPPFIPAPVYAKDGLVYELILEFGTGNDDLRGTNDNVYVIVHFFEGPSQRVDNANLRANWIKNYSQHVCIPLQTPVEAKYIKSIELVTTFGGGIGGDNWDLNYFNVRALGKNIDNKIYKESGNPLMRFTGNQKTFMAVINTVSPVAHVQDGKIRNLKFTIVTGGDDLRGGNDNLDITVVFGDGSVRTVKNVNNGLKWNNGTTNIVNFGLQIPVPPDQIKKAVLSTTFGGGMGGDNWNMDALHIEAEGGGIKKTIYSKTGKPLFRFTGDRKSFTADF
jgi:hypothetical protein